MLPELKKQGFQTTMGDYQQTSPTPNKHTRNRTPLAGGTMNDYARNTMNVT